jgi:uncharacterized protein YdcH (DUF465 family)
MPEVKKSTDLELAKDAVAHIEGIESLDELSAFVGEDEKRKTVLKANDAKYASLTEGSKSDDEDPEEVVTDETPETPEEPKVTEEEEQEEVVTDEAVTAEFLADVAEVIENKLANEKEFKGNNVDHTVKELKEAHEAFEKSTVVDEENETIEFSEEKFDAFRSAVANQANADQQRRGLSQPDAVDKALFDLHNQLNG